MSDLALIDFTQIKGGKAVVDQVDNLVAKTDVVTTERAGSAAASDDKVMSEAAVAQRLETVQAGFGRQAVDEVALEGASATTEFSVSCVPTDDKLILSVNGLNYVEDKHFTVNRNTKTVTWTYTATNGGFDLNSALTDNVKLTYLTREPAQPTRILADHCFGMVLVQEGNKSGTWVRVDRDFNTVPFDAAHGTWAGMKQVQNETYGEFTEIPVTYVKTEKLQSGAYVGKNCWWIADGPETGFHVHPAFIGQDGQPHNLQISSYYASNRNGTPFSMENGRFYDKYWNPITYNEMHAKGWMADGVRPYNIYDHHFMARMMLTEFGTPDVQSQTVDGVAWKGDKNRISYHGIHDPFGYVSTWYWLDGFTMLNGTYQILAPDGSGTMIETGVSCPNDYGYPVNCRIDQMNGVNFGDLFIASTITTQNSGSFAGCQYLGSGFGVGAYWNEYKYYGAFVLGSYALSYSYYNSCWRAARCAD